MRFSLIFVKRTIPEWQQCYYNYIECKQLIYICKKGYAIKCNIEDYGQQDSYSIQQNRKLIENKQEIEQITVSNIVKISLIIEQANSLFYFYHSLNKKVAYTFLLLKLHELGQHIDFFQTCKQSVVEKHNQMTKLLSNCYAQSLKLQSMVQLHLEVYYKIHRKHENTYKLFDMSSPNMRSGKEHRSLQNYKRFENKLNSIIQQKQAIKLREIKFKLEEQIEPSPFQLSLYSYLFGLLNGFSFCLIIAAIVLLAISLAPNSQPDRQIQILTFMNQYRLWKSTGFAILYMFIYAISYYIYEKCKINYPLIFGYEQFQKKSSRRLAISTLLLTLWSLFFVFYVLDLVGIYRVARVSSNPDYPITIFFPIIIFGIFLMFFVVQFISSKRGIIFFLLLMIKRLFKIFLCSEISFGIIWATQQLISLVQLVFDFSFSICYYSLLLKTPTVVDNYCLNLKIIPECIAIFIFSLRVLQSIKFSIQDRKYFGTRQMYRSIRSMINLTLCALSLGSGPQKWAILWIWVGLGIISGIYSFCIDVFIDWGQYIFYIEQKEIKKRQYSIYSQCKRNTIVVFNLIARFSFIITICPNMIFQYVENPELIISIAGLIQLLRRLFWNLMRMQNQQLKNNYFFTIKTDYARIKQKIKQEVLAKNPNLVLQKQLDSLRYKRQLELLRQLIRQKHEMTKKVLQFCKRNNQVLDQIQLSAEGQISAIVGVES